MGALTIKDVFVRLSMEKKVPGRSFYVMDVIVFVGEGKLQWRRIRKG